MYKRFALNGLSILGLLAGVAAHADREPVLYLGAGVGKVAAKIDNINFEDKDTGFKFFGGYRINNNLGAELTYFDGGSLNETQVYNSGLTLPATVENRTKVAFTGLNFSLMGRIPVADSFAMFGTIGYATYTVKVTDSGDFPVHYTQERDHHHGNFSYGGGAAFTFGKVEVRGEYESLNLNWGSFSFISLNGAYCF